MMELAIIQGALALAVCSAAFYLLLTGKINKSIDVRKNKKKMKTILLLIVMTPISNDIHKASWYGEKFHGRLTASGDTYNMNGLTCAATNDYEFGDRLKVTNIKNGKSVVVTVNDRGNFERLGRTLDLSRGAFDKIANLDKGVIDVKIERLENRITL